MDIRLSQYMSLNRGFSLPLNIKCGTMNDKYYYINLKKLKVN